MGTRHLIAIIVGGEYKVAQYGQWDGYPEGQGAAIIDFFGKRTVSELEEAAKNSKLLSDDEFQSKYCHLDDDIFGDEKVYHYNSDIPKHMNRDVGSGILKYLVDNPKGLELQNELNFAGDSLFCEWVYVIDLDKYRLEIYQGFNKTLLSENDRFFEFQDTSTEYKPVKIVTSYHLFDLPKIGEMVEDIKNIVGDEDE